MSAPRVEPPSRLTVADYLASAPDSFGDIEVVDGRIVRNTAQTELHSLVVRRLRRRILGKFERIMRVRRNVRMKEPQPV